MVNDVSMSVALERVSLLPRLHRQFRLGETLTKRLHIGAILSRLGALELTLESRVSRDCFRVPSSAPLPGPRTAARRSVLPSGSRISNLTCSDEAPVGMRSSVTS